MDAGRRGGIQSSYTFNDQQSILVNGAAFVEDQEVGGTDKGSVRAPRHFSLDKAIWNANWTKRFGTSLGIGGYILENPANLTTTSVPYINQGNTRVFYAKDGTYVLANNYKPIIADASATYKLDSFPLYPGAFPIKVGGEYINNVDTISGNNEPGLMGWRHFRQNPARNIPGIFPIVTNISYADAAYDQLVDDDNGAYYQNALTGGAVGWFSGTNIKGHMIKANYLDHRLIDLHVHLLPESIDYLPA